MDKKVKKKETVDLEMPTLKIEVKEVPQKNETHLSLESLLTPPLLPLRRTRASKFNKKSFKNTSSFYVTKPVNHDST